VPLAQHAHKLNERRHANKTKVQRTAIGSVVLPVLQADAAPTLESMTGVLEVTKRAVGAAASELSVSQPTKLNQFLNAWEGWLRMRYGMSLANLTTRGVPAYLVGALLIRMRQPGAKQELAAWLQARCTWRYNVKANGAYLPSTIANMKTALSTWHRLNGLYNPCIGDALIGGHDGVWRLIVESGPRRMRVAAVLDPWVVDALMQQLDLTTLHGLFIGIMFGASYMLMLRGDEVYFLNMSDVSVITWKGFNVILRWSKGSQRVEIKRGVQHRLGCPYSAANAQQTNPCDDSKKWCVPCMLWKPGMSGNESRYSNLLAGAITQPS
jgi:hypothetical protein